MPLQMRRSRRWDYKDRQAMLERQAGKDQQQASPQREERQYMIYKYVSNVFDWCNII